MAQLANIQLEIPYLFIKKAKEEYGFNKEYINAIIGDKETFDYFSGLESLFAKEGNEGWLKSKLIAKRMAWPIAARLKENFKTINQLPFKKDNFIEFLTKAQEGSLIENQLKIIMDEMLSTGKNPIEIIKEKWFDAPSIDSNEIEDMAKQILEENSSIVEQYKWGKTTTIWFFIGQLMKKTWGKTNPKIAQEIFEKLLW